MALMRGLIFFVVTVAWALVVALVCGPDAELWEVFAWFVWGGVAALCLMRLVQWATSSRRRHPRYRTQPPPISGLRHGTTAYLVARRNPVTPSNAVDRIGGLVDGEQSKRLLAQMKR